MFPLLERLDRRIENYGHVLSENISDGEMPQLQTTAINGQKYKIKNAENFDAGISHIVDDLST